VLDRRQVDFRVAAPDLAFDQVDTNLADHVDAVAIREAEIEHDQIGFARSGFDDAPFAGRRCESACCCPIRR
jgi:hypothetical protein